MLYLTVHDISIRLNVNSETVRRWIRNGDLKAIQNSKKEGYLITEEDYENFCNRTKYTELPTKDSIKENILKLIEFHEGEIERLKLLLKNRV